MLYKIAIQFAIKMARKIAKLCHNKKELVYQK